jgi:DNA (cytosine-5)-methyltransferase 1
MKYNAISLFSGMGGDSLGMQNAGLNLIGYSEYQDVFRQTHELNFPNCKLIGKEFKSDILKIPDSEFEKYYNKVDFLFAGFPCQSFSTGGKRKINDPRNTMFREFVRVAKYTNAKVVIGENVKGLMTKKTETGEKYIDIIQHEFENLGYKVITKVFECHKYNIPQKRERLIILGIKKEFLEKGLFNLAFPEENDQKNCNLIDIVKFDMTGTLKITDVDYDFKNIPNECILKDMDNTSNEQNPHPYLVLKKTTNNKEYNNKKYKSLFSFSKRDSPIHCEIIDIRKPCKTIICTYDHQPRLLVPIQNKCGNYLRTLTPNELKQIQGFPKDYKMCGSLKQQIIQIGNAVPPLLIEKIINTILFN